jgi:hypothetical protein
MESQQNNLVGICTVVVIFAEISSKSQQPLLHSSDHRCGKKSTNSKAIANFFAPTWMWQVTSTAVDENVLYSRRPQLDTTFDSVFLQHLQAKGC